MDAHLRALEQKSVYWLREAKARFRNVAVLWSMGKDSTCMLQLCRRAFFGRVPFPAIHIDSGHDFPETYAFRETVSREWKVELLVAPAEDRVDSISGTAEGLNKAEALRGILEQRGFDALVVSIRRDEHGIRAKERYFSPRDSAFRWDFRNQPPEVFHYGTDLPGASHVRVHPLLDWTELDVWEYTKASGIPVHPLYFARNGRRYRSLGYPTATMPIPSKAATLDQIIEELGGTELEERSGRALDKEKEYVMQRLRELGYM